MTRPESNRCTDRFETHWYKLPLIGCPGTECGRQLIEGGDTGPTDFPNDGCTEPARWAVGMLLLCQEHAAQLAAEGGDDIAEIAAAYREAVA